MKRFLLALIFVFISISVCVAVGFADWDIDVSISDVKGPYVIYKIYCVSDGDVLAATDFVALMSTEEKQYLKRGATMMVMNTDPGTGGAAPLTEIDIVLTDITGMAVFTEADINHLADTIGTDLSTDMNQYPVMTSKMYISMNDIGNEDDEVTFYIYCWVELK